MLAASSLTETSMLITTGSASRLETRRDAAAGSGEAGRGGEVNVKGFLGFFNLIPVVSRKATFGVVAKGCRVGLAPGSCGGGSKGVGWAEEVGWGGAGGKARTRGQRKDVGAEEGSGHGAKTWGQGREAAVGRGLGRGWPEAAGAPTAATPGTNPGSVKAPRRGRPSPWADPPGTHPALPGGPSPCPAPWARSRQGTQTHRPAPRAAAVVEPPGLPSLPPRSDPAAFDDVEPSFLKPTSCKFSCCLYM